MLLNKTQNLLPALFGEFKCWTFCKLLHAEICASSRAKFAQSLENTHTHTEVSKQKITQNSDVFESEYSPPALEHVFGHFRFSCTGLSAEPRHWLWWMMLSWLCPQREWAPPLPPAGEWCFRMHKGRWRHPWYRSAPGCGFPHHWGPAAVQRPPVSLVVSSPYLSCQSDACRKHEWIYICLSSVCLYIDNLCHLLDIFLTELAEVFPLIITLQVIIKLIK